MWLKRKKPAPSKIKVIKTLVLHFDVAPKDPSLRDDFLSFVRATSDNVIVCGEDRPIEVSSFPPNTHSFSSLPPSTSSVNSLSSLDSSPLDHLTLTNTSISHFPTPTTLRSPEFRDSISYNFSSDNLANNNYVVNNSLLYDNSSNSTLAYDPATEFPPLEVIVELKNIKRIYLRVIPPKGIVKVSAPLRISSQTIRRFIEKEREWINNAQEKIYKRNQQFATSDNAIRDGESSNNIDLITPHATEKKSPYLSDDIQHFPLPPEFAENSEENKKKKSMLLKKHVDAHIDRWIRIVGKEPTHIGYRAMKTRWGSCTPATGRIRLNIALTLLNNTLIEYVVIHELVHLHVPGHGPLFREHMDRCLPNWRQLRAQLNQYSRTHSI